MKRRKNIRISLYLLVPAIFSGISLLAVILTYRVMSYTRDHHIDPAAPVVWLGFAAVVLVFACSFMIIRLILQPISRFVKTAEKLYAVSGAAPVKIDVGSAEDVEHFHQVFDQVTAALGKLEARELFPEIIGQSRAMRQIFSQIMKIAPTDATVLIMGESGTGKELVATSLYEHSQRKGKPFIKISCVAIPEGLLESELFGHEKGAFTGAIAQKKGKFELADGGTIFLDEIGDMPPATQAKLLRVLQEREFERVGGAQPLRVDVRFIAATNKNLVGMIREGSFRDDLFHRLNMFSLYIPSLRERREDIPLLIDHFLEKSRQELSVSSRAMQMLLGYNWPGNVRELQHVTQRAAIFAEKTIEAAHLPAELTGETAGGSDGTGKRENTALDERLGEIEKGMIIEALNQAGGVQARAAQILGINSRSLWHRVKKYEIDASAFKKAAKIVERASNYE